VTVLINSKIFDGEASRLFDGLNVFIHGDRIVEVSARPPNPDDGGVVDCGNRTLMPGLIDAHVHAYALSASIYEMDKAPPSLRAAWAGPMLSRMLDRGFTTVRDTGGADYGLAIALQRGYIQGPRLYYCGFALSQTGGVGDFRDPEAYCAHDDQLLACGCGFTNSLNIVVDGVDGVRRAIRENLRRGSNFIKFFGSGGVTSTGDSLDSVQYSDEEIRAIVDEVERHGAYCTAHIHPDRALKRVISLGVHCIEHGTLIEPDTAQMAAEMGTAIVPTVAIVAALAAEGKELGLSHQSLEKLKRIKDEAVRRMQHMKDAGVRVGFGSDLLGRTERLQCTEFGLRKEIFSSHEILMQATSMNAQIIGAKGDVGVIKAGAYADLLVVEGDPVNDISLLEQDGRALAGIIRNGTFHKRTF